MTATVDVALGSRSYSIQIGPGLLNSAGALLETLARGVVPVVTDENVARLHLPALLSSLRMHKLDALPIVLPPGEQTKSFASLEGLCREMIRVGVERSGLVIAFGGGVIGDLAGLAAGLVKRGIGYAQIPTTLLSQVDSSVGGKTAIDLPEGKNLIGLFHQPRTVIADTDLLTSLPRRELLAGYAEVAKYGALGDLAFFCWLEGNAVRALNGDQIALERMIAHSCRMKAEIVARDETEAGERALLNLGHTFAHALEAATGYSGALLHGEAVAIGMVLAFQLSEQLGLSPADDTMRLIRHLKNVGLPTTIREISGFQPDPDSIFVHMKHDKKAAGQSLKFVLARGIGGAFVSADVPEASVRTLLAG
ncbi:MAG TPA: 3-dehydroquinate synthase [Rhizomicrobium sp.]|nr:3-dehydroquinate synthase [Rhizomicrobium sp.]